jgi:hypothetical protein
VSLTESISLRETMYSCYEQSKYCWNRYNVSRPFRRKPSSGRTVPTAAACSVRQLRHHVIWINLYLCFNKADYLALMAKEETVLNDITNLNWEMLWNRNECGKNQGNKNLNGTIRQYILWWIKKKLENMAYFKYLVRMITNDARSVHSIVSYDRS